MWNQKVDKSPNKVECRCNTAKLVVFFQSSWSATNGPFLFLLLFHVLGKNNTFTPMLCYFDPVRCNANKHVILNMSMKIRQLLNVMWRNKFGSKLDKIENPFSKRSLSLLCPKGKNIIIVSNNPLLWIFFQMWKISKLNHIFFIFYLLQNEWL